jgi:hypothetical protein
MYYLLNVCGIATAAIAFAGVAPSAVAQENTDIFACQYVRGGSNEPLGDREGHSLRVAEFSCLGTSGPLSGGIFTGSTVTKMDKGNGVLLAGNGVVRKPGATTVHQLTDGKIALTMADGKVTGFTGSGHGAYSLAIGSAASVSIPRQSRGL